VNRNDLFQQLFALPHSLEHKINTIFNEGNLLEPTPPPFLSAGDASIQYHLLVADREMSRSQEIIKIPTHKLIAVRGLTSITEASL